MRDPWDAILREHHTVCLESPIDEFSVSGRAHLEQLKAIFLTAPYNQVFDFIQVALRYSRVLPKFPDDVESVLSRCMCAYTVVEDGPRIVPIALPEQRESIQKAFQVLKTGPFEGAQSHLRQSADYINNGDLAGSVRESIHAVESVAKRLDAKAGKTLDPALDALSQKVLLHPALSYCQKWCLED